MKIFSLFFLLLFTQLLISQKHNNTASCESDQFLQDPSISVNIKKGYMDELTDEDLNNDRIYFETKSLVTSPLEPLSIARTKFNLRALLNIYKQATMLNDYFGLDLPYDLARFIENRTLVFAGAFDGSGCLGDDDLQTLASISLKGLLLYHREKNMNLELEKFIERINYYAKGGTPDNKQVIELFSKHLKKPHAQKTTISLENYNDPFDYDWLEHLELDKQFRKAPRLKDFEKDSLAEYHESQGKDDVSQVHKMIGDMDLVYFFYPNSVAKTVNIQFRARDLRSYVREKYRLDCDGIVEYYPNGKIKRFLVHGSTMVNDSLQIEYHNFINITGAEKGKAVDKSVNHFKQDAKTIMYLSKTTFTKPPVPLPQQKTRYIRIDPSIFGGKKYWAVCYFWDEGVLKYLVIDDDTLKTKEVSKEEYYRISGLN